MLGRLLLAASLLLGANALVDFGDSVLLDEFDLSTLKTFPLPQCISFSCKVFVSAPAESLKTLDKIYLGDTTLGALARKVDSESGLKTPYNLKAFSGKAFIANLNWNFASAPVAVYIVYQRAALYNSGIVYEPTGTPLNIQLKNASSFTILSATNFTLKGEVKQGSLAGGKVYAAGFDLPDRNWASAPALYKFANQRSFEFGVLTPLVTLYSTTEAEVELRVENGYKASTSSAFLTSPGFTGVLSGQVYLSSLYNTTVQYNLTYEQATTLLLEFFLNTFTDSVVTLIDGVEVAHTSGTRGLPNYHQRFSVTGRDFAFRFNNSLLYSSFLLRYTVDEVVSPPTEAPLLPSESPVDPQTDVTIILPSETPNQPKTDVPSETPKPDQPQTQSPVVPSENSVEPIVSEEPAVPEETHIPVEPIVTEAPIVPIETEKPAAPVDPKDPQPNNENPWDPDIYKHH